MNPAAVLSVCAATLEAGAGLLVASVSRAPGWRAARPLAVIAFSAAAYSATNVVFALEGVPDGTRIIAARLEFLFAAIHAVAWLHYVRGGSSSSKRALPPAVRLLGLGTLALGLLCQVPGVVENGTVESMAVASFGVRYWMPRPTTLGSLAGAWMLAVLVVPFWTLVQRVRRGAEDARWHFVGFAVFYVCAMVEVLVASGVIRFFYLSDVGFLAVVGSVAGVTVNRMIAGARDLARLTERLASQVQERTEERDRAQDALVEVDRQAAVGRLAAGVGHEINNPLTYVKLSLEAVDEWARRENAPPEIQEALASARNGTDRIRRVVDDLRAYTRARPGTFRPVALESVAQNALRVAQAQLRHVARLGTTFREAPPTMGDEARLVQVVVNLLTNAGQAIAESPAHAEASIEIRTGTADDGRAYLEVVDTGPGIAPAHQRRLAEPYFTTRAGVGGTGLGLFLARGIVDRHAGTLDIDSTPGGGTTVRILMPPGRQRVVPPRDKTLASLEPARRRVLVVDDDELVARSLARSLRGHCEVAVARSGSAALDRIEAEPHWDTILCDLMMPGMTGMDLAEAVAARDPALRARMVFITGGAVTPAAREFVARPDVVSLQKPVSVAELLRAVEQAAEAVAAPTPSPEASDAAS